MEKIIYNHCTIDHYSKFLEEKILEEKTAKTVLEAIKELIFGKHGIPKKIITDNGLELNNQFTRQFPTYYGIDWTYNSPYHHNTVGHRKSQ